MAERSVRRTLANKRGEDSEGKVPQTVWQGNSGWRVGPGGSEAATSFFLEAYHSELCLARVDADTLSSGGGTGLFSVSELARVIKRMRTQTAPSPFDRVGYTIFKSALHYSLP